MKIETRHPFDWFPFYPDDFFNSPRVKCMTLGEIGAYVTLLCYAWREPECALTNDQADLKILAGWDTAQSTDRWERVMACWPKHPTRKKMVHNPRLYKEWLRARQISGERRQAAMKRHHPERFTTPKPATRLHDRSAGGFESISQLADKHFPPK